MDTAGIIHNAEQALIQLLVDIPTAQALEARTDTQHMGSGNMHGGQPASSTNSPHPSKPHNPAEHCRKQAHAAALALAVIARQQLANEGRCIGYGSLEPHVGAIMDWRDNTTAGDFGEGPTWASHARRLGCFSRCSEAFEALCVGTRLAHPADVLAVGGKPRAASWTVAATRYRGRWHCYNSTR